MPTNPLASGSYAIVCKDKISSRNNGKIVKVVRTLDGLDGPEYDCEVFSAYYISDGETIPPGSIMEFQRCEIEPINAAEEPIVYLAPVPAGDSYAEVE